VLECPRHAFEGDVARRWFLMPLRDLWGFAVWLAGTVGSTVEWQGEKLRLDKEGRIIGVSQAR